MSRGQRTFYSFPRVTFLTTLDCLPQMERLLIFELFQPPTSPNLISDPFPIYQFNILEEGKEKIEEEKVDFSKLCWIY